MNDTGKRIYQFLILGVGLVMLVVPPLVVVSSGTARDSAQWTSLRLLALYAFTLLFINVVIGAARPLFNRIFPPRKVFVFHNFIGLAALLLALGHGTLALIYGLSGYKGAYVALGPTVLVLLVVTVSAALARKQLKRLWRPLHRLNYLLFVIVLVHAWFLGFDLKYASDKTVMRGAVLIYAGTAAAALIYRIDQLVRASRKRRARAAST
jgi:DMSO/TMAO reductase YedYZ heme-binding membrane subunit